VRKIRINTKNSRSLGEVRLLNPVLPAYKAGVLGTQRRCYPLSMQHRTEGEGSTVGFSRVKPYGRDFAIRPGKALGQEKKKSMNFI
jgi:hypothetical protein